MKTLLFVLLGVYGLFIVAFAACMLHMVAKDKKERKNKKKENEKS